MLDLLLIRCKDSKTNSQYLLNLIYLLSIFQLDKIFRVVGTPTDDTWPGVSSLPNYKPHKLCYYPPPTRLGEVWPRLVDVPFAESLATLLLQQKAQKRTGADQALRHRYFAELPHKIFEIDDGKHFFLVFLHLFFKLS